MKIQDSISIGQIIKQRRISLGLTQEETAQMCHVGKRFFSELENGKATLQLSKVLHCIEILGINLYAVNREEER